MEEHTKYMNIKKYFPLHTQCIVKTFTHILLCMLKLRTTCMYKCKDKMPEVTGKKHTQAMSHYTQIIRFFKIPKIDEFCQGVFMMIFELLGINSNMIVLDRTNWKIGKKNINLLTIGVLFHNCFIPLCWQQLNKRGNSNFKERINLIDYFIKLWEKAGKSIKEMIVIADREFIGTDWLCSLNEITLYFVFRLRENMYFELYNKPGKKHQLRSFAGKIERYGVYTVKILVNGLPFYLVMTKNLKTDRKEPYIYFITNVKNAYEVLEHYTKRWKIECCFKHLKSNGFDIEAMNLKKDEKIELMMGLVATAYAIAIKEGMLEYIRKPFRIKKYQNGKIYMEVSIFRKGIEILEVVLFNWISFLDYLIDKICKARLNPLVIKVLPKNV